MARHKTIRELLAASNSVPVTNGVISLLQDQLKGDAWEGGRRPNEYAGDHTLDLEELVWEPPPWPSLPQEALYGLPGEIVRTIEPTSEADPVALLIQNLITFGSIIGRTAHFRAEDDVHYLNEYGVLIGKTAKGRKGSSWARACRIIAGADPGWLAHRVQGGLSSAEGLIEAVRDAVLDKKGAVIAASVADKRLLAFEGEFASVLRQNERKGNTLSAILRNLWDGQTARTLTRSPLCATGAHVSLIGHCTADELTRLLSTTEAANGFGNRILWCCVRRSKVLPDGSALREDQVQPHQLRFQAAVEFARDVGEMRRDDEARTLWHQVYGTLSAGKPGLAGSLLARGEAHVMRLACIYALMDMSYLVRVEHLQAALALWGYVEESVRYVWGSSLGDPHADRILCILRASPAGLSRSQISGLFGRNLSAEKIGRALALLAEFNLARRELRETGGRRAENWFANEIPATK